MSVVGTAPTKDEGSKMHSEQIKMAHTVHIIADAPVSGWDVWYMVGDGAWKLGYSGGNKRAAWELAKLATAARISYKPSFGAPGRLVQGA